MPALLAASLLALAAQAPGHALPERERTLGEASIGGWELWAMMTIDHNGAQPVIDDIVCNMERDGLKLATGNVGGLSISLEDGDDYRRRDVRAIGLGGAVWEYRFRTYEPAESHFADVEYPPPPPPGPLCGGRRGHDIILYGCPQTLEMGTPLVRRSPGEPWLHIETLANEMLRATALRVGFRDRDAGESAPLRWADVPLGGLPEALAWCQSAMRSQATRRLRRE